MTALGRIVAVVTVMLGIFCFALPVAIIGRGFYEEIRRRDFIVTFAMIARIPLFSGLDAASISDLIAALSARTVPASTVIVQKGDRADCMFFIASVLVDVSNDVSDVQLFEGDYFGEMALLLQERRNATVTAVRSRICWSLMPAISIGWCSAIQRSLKPCTSWRNCAARPDVISRGCPMSEPLKSLAGIDAFRDLSAKDLKQLESLSKLIKVERGQLLFRQGELADALYLVISSRFQVMRDNERDPVAAIGAGLPIGEIAFFAGGVRTANIIAERDSVVLKLDRNEFDALARTSPRMLATLTSTLARRLADTTSSRGMAPTRPRPKTYCLLPIGGTPISAEFLLRLRTSFQRRVNALFLNAPEFEKIQAAVLDADQWLNEVESRYDAVIFVVNPSVSAWSQKAIRQSDLVLCIGAHDIGDAPADCSVTPLEQYAAALHKSGRMHLVLLHTRAGEISGTRQWLDLRPWCAMHHHVQLDVTGDYERLFRFMTDRALGLVACGGGAFSTAHIGFYQAFREVGIVFDMMGGASGGAAMTAAFAIGAEPDEIERRAHDIFVTRKALSRWTLPRYSLFDPTVLDAAFREHYTSIDIADLPIPYFAVSTNLSRNSVHCHRTGPLWHAVRASCTIPALLPPMYTDDGDMLVDGALLENVPVRSMHALKSGPNIVIDFQVPAVDDCNGNSTQPSRRQLIMGSLTARGRNQLPRGPSPQAVLLRSLMLHSRNVRTEIGPDDVLLEPMLPTGISHLDWHKHEELRRFGYAFAQREIARLNLTSLVQRS